MACCDGSGVSSTIGVWPVLCSVGDCIGGGGGVGEVGVVGGSRGMGVGLWCVVCGAVVTGGVLWWGEVCADGGCIRGWGGGSGGVVGVRGWAVVGVV